jgi:hypothetical protein
MPSVVRTRISVAGRLLKRTLLATAISAVFLTSTAMLFIARTTDVIYVTSAPRCERPFTTDGELDIEEKTAISLSNKYSCEPVSSSATPLSDESTTTSTDDASFVIHPPLCERVSASFPEAEFTCDHPVFLSNLSLDDPGLRKRSRPYGLKGVDSARDKAALVNVLQKINSTLSWSMDARLRKSTAAFPTRCVVVGSGGNLLNQGLGERIDAYDVVFRINDAPTTKKYVYITFFAF